MTVKIRLTRRGKKKEPHYRLVVVDQRAPRDGRFIDMIGRYDPRTEPSLVEIDKEKALLWLGRGAQPSAAATKLLKIRNILKEFEATRKGPAKKAS